MMAVTACYGGNQVECFELDGDSRSDRSDLIRSDGAGRIGHTETSTPGQCD